MVGEGDEGAVGGVGEGERGRGKGEQRKKIIGRIWEGWWNG